MIIGHRSYTHNCLSCVHNCDDQSYPRNEHIVSTVPSCMLRLGQINRVEHIFDKRTLIS